MSKVRGPLKAVKTSKALSVELARLASVIRASVSDVLALESGRGRLRRLYEAFQAALIHDLSEADFADMYAQTVAYGLLSARLSRESGALGDGRVADLVPVTNPFLKELMQTFLTAGGRPHETAFDELGIHEIVELLGQADMASVLKDFGDRHPDEDPVLHFYELFLKEYDPRKRMQRGVFYTPKPVVSFMVRSVDDMLRTEFRLEDGLADTTTWGEMRRRHRGLRIPEGVKPDAPFVQILDPAAGTGTFLVEAIEVIYRTMRARWGREGKGESAVRALWNEYVPRHLLPRLHGFELMMAPYVIAHLKIGLKLAETKYAFSSGARARVYLTNTLEAPKSLSRRFEQAAAALAHEARAASEIKLSAPITVVIGNPPYSNYSANLSAEARKMVDKYRTFRGLKIRERNQLQFERNLQDDFVKFIAHGEEWIRRCRTGVMMLITNATFLNSRSLRGAREHLAQTFDFIWALHLHGGSNEKFGPGQTDQNVFDIEQMVAIHAYAKAPGAGAKRFRFAELIGERKAKSSSLAQMNLQADRFSPFLPDEANGSFTPVSRNAEGLLIPLDAIFIQFGAGIKTNRDATVIAFDRQSLDSQLGTIAAPALSDRRFIQPLLYRPFDQRLVFYHRDYIASRSYPTMKHMLETPNLGLLACGTWTSPHLFSVNVSRSLVEMKTGTHDRGTTFFPLYRLDEVNGHKTVSVNINARFIALWEALTNTRFIKESCGDLEKTFGAEDILHWAYACFHSPSYRETYSGELAQGFPLLPLCRDSSLIKRLAALGADLVALHLLDDDYEWASWNQERKDNPLKHLPAGCPGGAAAVAKGYPKYQNGGVFINPTCAFDGVPEAVWRFHMGGYQVCEKWLKDRRGRTLSAADITHYQRMAVAIRETLRLMAEIDEVIAGYGGWPLQ